MFGFTRASGHNDEISKLIREKGQPGLCMDLRLLEAPPKNKDGTLAKKNLQKLLSFSQSKVLVHNVAT